MGEGTTVSGQYKGWHVFWSPFILACSSCARRRNALAQAGATCVREGGAFPEQQEGALMRASVLSVSFNVDSFSFLQIAMMVLACPHQSQHATTIVAATYFHMRYFIVAYTSSYAFAAVVNEHLTHSHLPSQRNGITTYHQRNNVAHFFYQRSQT